MRLTFHEGRDLPYLSKLETQVCLIHKLFGGALRGNIWQYSSYLHFTSEEIEAQRGWLIYPRPELVSGGSGAEILPFFFQKVHCQVYTSSLYI